MAAAAGPLTCVPSWACRGAWGFPATWGGTGASPASPLCPPPHPCGVSHQIKPNFPPVSHDERQPRSSAGSWVPQRPSHSAWPRLGLDPRSLPGRQRHSPRGRFQAPEHPSSLLRAEGNPGAPQPGLQQRLPPGGQAGGGGRRRLVKPGGLGCGIHVHVAAGPGHVFCFPRFLHLLAAFQALRPAQLDLGAGAAAARQSREQSGRARRGSRDAHVQENSGSRPQRAPGPPRAPGSLHPTRQPPAGPRGSCRWRGAACRAPGSRNAGCSQSAG